MQNLIMQEFKVCNGRQIPRITEYFTLYRVLSKEYFTKLQFKTSHDFNARNICTYMQKLPFQMYANIVLCTQILSCVRKYFPVYANIVLCTLWEQFKETQCSLCKGRRKALRYLLFFFLQICPTPFSKVSIPSPKVLLRFPNVKLLLQNC